ncbi:MAG: MerC domain-containing protein [Gammaproteobacteria bacterium]|nr:MerC domain-containing protein [Gammaproteobacteria bacterium]MYB39582.1 MerC domain-containing protein [Gammaproteobacteria bacterium]
MALESKPVIQSPVLAEGHGRALLGHRGAARDRSGAIAMHPPDAESVRWSAAGRPDLYAAGLSMLCVLHCVALPVLVAFMPMVAQAAQSELVHKLLVLAAVPVSLRVVWQARSVTGNRLFFSVVFAGLALLSLAAFAEPLSAYEEPVTIFGGTLLISAHIWHWLRRCGGRSVPSAPMESSECLDCRCPE